MRKTSDVEVVGAGSDAIERLRVVHLLSADLWAGAEVSTYHAVCALAMRPDVEVSVIALNEGEFADRVAARGIPIRVLPERRLSFLDLVREVRHGVGDCNVVHAHRYKENLLAALSGRPWVSTQHGRPEPFRGGAMLRARLYGAVDRIAKLVSARRTIAVSSEVEAWLAERIGARRVVRVWNGIADPQADLLPPPWVERPLRVGVLGRLAPVKRFELAIEAVARCDGLELEIVGDGPQRSWLESRVQRLGVGERIHFRGHLARPLDRVMNWRALLVTSLHEGNPMSVLEALALGTPVVYGQLAGVKEALAGEAGWVVPEPADADVWARTLEAVVYDEAAGEENSRTARARFLNAFTSETTAAQLVSVYREALSS